MFFLKEIGPDRVLEIPPKYYERTMNTTEVLSDMSDGAILIFERADYSEKDKVSFQSGSTAFHFLESVFDYCFIS